MITRFKIYLFTFILLCCCGFQSGVAGDARGVSLEKIAVYNSNALGSGSTRSFIRTNNGYFHLVYYNKYKGNNEIYYTRSGDNGKTWSTPLNLSNNLGDSLKPTIVTDEYNRLYVFWEDDARILFVNSTDSGLTWGSVFSIAGDVRQAQDVCAAADFEGNLFAVWSNRGSIYYRKYDANKKDWQHILNISKPYYGSQNPGIIIDREHNLHVIWEKRGEILYRQYSAGNRDWSPEIINLNGDLTTPAGKIEILPGFENSKQFFTVDMDSLVIYGKLLNRNSQDVILKIGKSQYSAKVRRGRYQFNDISLENGDNAYTITSQTSGGIKLISTGFISLKVPDARNPVIAVGDNGAIHAIWEEGAGLVYRYSLTGNWSRQTYSIAAKIKSRQGNSDIAVDHHGDVFFAWVNDSLYWRSYSVSENKLSSVQRVGAAAEGINYNPRFISTVSDTFNVSRPQTGFDLLWLSRSRRGIYYRFKYFSNSFYASIPPPATNVLIEKVSSKKIKINWSALKGQAVYQVQVSKTADFETALFYDSGFVKGISNSHVLGRQLRDGIYYIRVRLADQSQTWGPFSSTEYFTMTAVEVPSPKLKQLVEFSNADRIQISWKNPAMADSKQQFLPDRYEAECAKDPGFRNIVARSKWRTVDNYYFKGLPEGKYFFRVRGQNTIASLKKSGWSNTVSTIVDLTPPQIENIAAWLDINEGIAFSRSFTQNRKIYISSKSKGHTLFLKPEFSEKYPHYVQANNAFRVVPQYGFKENDWILSYKIPTSNFGNQKVLLKLADLAGNTATYNLYFILDDGLPNVLGSWKITGTGLVSRGDVLYFKGRRGSVSVNISGIVNDLGSGIDTLKYYYVSEEQIITSDEKNQWSLSEVLNKLPEPGRIIVTAKDKVGNTVEKSFDYRKDDTPPSVNIHSVKISNGYLYFHEEQNTLYLSPKLKTPENVKVRGYFDDAASGIADVDILPLWGAIGQIKRYQNHPNRWQVTCLLDPEKYSGPTTLDFLFYDKLRNYFLYQLNIIKDKTPPRPPLNVKAFPQTEDGQVEYITLTWDDTQDAESGVKFYRAGLDVKWQNNPVRHTSSDIKVEPGRHVCYVYAIDNVGNVSLAGTDALIVYPKNPRLIYPEADSIINAVTPTLRWTRTIDSGHYIVELAENQDFTVGHRKYRVEDEIAQMPDKDRLKNGKTYYWRVRSYDLEGKVLTRIKDTQAAKFTIDTKGPTNLFFSIENGAVYTNKKKVKLSIDATDAEQVIISEDRDFADAYWQKFAPVLAYELSVGEGLKTIYVKYMDEYGNKSQIIKDSIIIDKQSPMLFTSLSMPQFNDDYKSEVKVQVFFNEAVAGNLSQVFLELPDQTSILVENTLSGEKLWEGRGVLPESRGYSGEALLYLDGEISDLAGNSLALPLTFKIKVDNEPPVIESFRVEGSAKSRLGDRLNFFIRGEHDCEASVQIDSLKTINLKEVSSGEYSGQWQIDTLKSFENMSFISVLEDDAGNKAKKQSSSKININLLSPELVEDFEVVPFKYSFKNQVGFEQFITSEAKGKGLRVLKVNYQVTAKQPWAAFSFKQLPSKNYRGYKPVLQFWIKGSGSNQLKGAVKFRREGRTLDENWLLSGRKEHSFSLNKKGWQLIKIELSAEEMKILDKLAFIDMIIYTSGRAESGSLLIDDVSIYYSML
ncbi:hypothetical protein ACFL4D_03010 [Candidatus Margulisiibacteriota bacterium]